MNKTATAVIVLLILGLGVWVLSRNNKEDMGDTMANTPADTSTTTGETATTGNDSTGAVVGVDVSTNVSVGTVKEILVTGKNFSFSPSIINVNKGDRVRITFKNVQGTHDFRLTGYELKTKMLNEGQQDTIEFVAANTGSFEFYCSMGNHREMGMTGTLVIR